MRDEAGRAVGAALRVALGAAASAAFRAAVSATLGAALSVALSVALSAAASSVLISAAASGELARVLASPCELLRLASLAANGDQTQRGRWCGVWVRRCGRGTARRGKRLEQTEGRRACV